MLMARAGLKQRTPMARRICQAAALELGLSCSRGAARNDQYARPARTHMHGNTGMGAAARPQIHMASPHLVRCY